MESARPTTPDGHKSFKSTGVKTEQSVKNENVKSNLADNKTRSSKAKNKPKNNKKIEETKSAGQSFISRYFRGFTSVERANIKADLDDTLPFRIIDNYQPSVQSYATWKNYSESESLAEKLDVQLFGAISLGIATKLHISSTDAEKKVNKLLSSLETKIILPKKLGVLLDQIGKSDIPGDNHFRIRNQNFAAKRHLMRAIFNLIPESRLVEYLDDDEDHSKWKDLNGIMHNPDLFPNMVDNSNWSYDRIKVLGKQIYEDRTKQNFKFWKDKSKKEEEVDPDDIFYMRLPKLDFEQIDISTVGKVMSNLLFSTFGHNTGDLAIMASGLVLSIVKLKWIKEPQKKMEELEPKFNNTWFAGKTFNQILAYCGIWNISYYFDDLTINDLGLEAIKLWNTGYSKIFSSFLEMNEIPFGEHGTDAQMIQVDRDFMSNKKGIMGYNTYGFVKKSKASTALKVGENNSLLGLMVGYTKNLTFESDWEVEFNSTNKSILYEFLKNDFKDNY